jgi:hypothetical protein
MKTDYVLLYLESWIGVIIVAVLFLVWCVVCYPGSKKRKR